MLTHKEEFVLSPKRTSSIMLTLLLIEGATRQKLLPFLLKTHIYMVWFISTQRLCQKYTCLIINIIRNRRLFAYEQLSGFIHSSIWQRHLYNKWRAKNLIYYLSIT